jgi:hypothetical protein
MMEDNDLLAELNGTAATPAEAAELAHAEKEAKADPLAVPAPRKKTAARIAKEKAEAAAAASGTAVKGYAVTVSGEYTVSSTEVPGKKMKKPYTITVNVPELEGALSTIKNKLLDKVLKLKYPGYITFLTHEIVDTKPLTADTPPAANVAYMSLSQLQNHVREQRLPIDLDKYGEDVKNLRTAVVDCVLNPGGFVEREKKRLASIAEDKALEALNNIPS